MAVIFIYLFAFLLIMVDFGARSGTGYAHALDREYTQYGHDHDDGHAHSHGDSGSPMSSTNDVGVKIGDLGMSLGLGPVPNVQAIGAKLRPGVKKLEFVFTGMGKGSGQGQTPEMYGLKQRQALLEMSKANRVDFSTHSTVGVYGLAGMDQQGNFSKTSKTMSLQEVKRAIEFAADVTHGGPVVVHTGEFNRPVVDAEWNQKEGDPWKGKFRLYEQEGERASYRVVDTRTGAVIQEARKNRNVSRPVWNMAKEEYWEMEGEQKVLKKPAAVDAQGRALDEYGRPIYIDYFGKRLDPEDRVPLFDGEQFKVQQLNWDDLRHEATEMTQRARDMWRDWKEGKLSEDKWKGSYWWKRFSKEENGKIVSTVHDEKEIEIRPEEAYIISTLETNAANARGWAIYYGGDFDKTIERLEKLKKAKEFYEQLEATTDESEKWRLMRQASEFGELIPPESKFPSKIIEEQIRHFERQLKQSQEASSAQWAQSEEAKEQIRHVQSAEVYALQEAYESYAQLGIAALRQTEKLKQEGKYKESLKMALENLFPEHYGAHPDELIHLIDGSRKKMAQLLQQQNKDMSDQKARQLAEEHITSTFDTGHMNMWRKYWRGDPDKTLKENDEEFNHWVLDKVKEMAQKNIIGHVHLDDNYGYHDDHLAPGEGNTPIKGIIKVLKENGYKGKLIVEPGADYTTDVSGFHSVMKTWRDFGIPVYGKRSGLEAKRRTWSDVGYGFFGQAAPPYFVFGAYSPSEDWTLWSGVPLE